MQDADQSRSSKRQAHTSPGSINLIVGLASIDPGHLHAAASEIQEQSATFNTYKPTAGTQDSAKQSFHRGLKDAHFETTGH